MDFQKAEGCLRRSFLSLPRSAPAAAASALFFSAAALLPVLLAGAREYTVGTDIATYGNYVFYGALEMDRPPSLFGSVGDIEPLYRLLAYGVSRLTNNAHWFYFATAMIVCTGIMAGLLHWRRYCSVTLGWAAFLFLFYGDTLNTMRQSLALALVFWGVALFTEEKYFGYAFLQGLAVMFHVTGAIGIFLAALYLLVKKGVPRQAQFFFIGACFAAVLFYSPLLQAVLNAKLLPAKFSRYVADGIAFAPNPTILRLPFLLPILYYYERFCGGGTEAVSCLEPEAVSCLEPEAASCLDSEAASCLEPEAAFGLEPEAEDAEDGAFGAFLVLALLLEICAVQLRSVRPALYRLSQYFGCFRFLAYARLVRILRRDNRALAAAALIAFLVVVWYYQNVVQGNNQIYPYAWDPRWFWRRIPVFPELPEMPDISDVPVMYP